MPIDVPTLAAFVGASLAVVLSPGPDTVLILRYTFSSGRGVGTATVAGVQLGLIGHTLLAVVGLSVVIASSPKLFAMIAIVGALYIAWLGVQGIRAGVIRIGDTAGSKVTHVKALRDAALTNLLNPKVILLFLALMPNFVDVARGQVPGQLVALGATLIVVNTIWQLPLALAADSIRGILNQPLVQRIVNWSTGVILIGFATLMLAEHVF